MRVISQLPDPGDSIQLGFTSLNVAYTQRELYFYSFLVFYFAVLQPKQAGKFNIYFYVFDLIFLFFNFTITV